MNRIPRMLIIGSLLSLALGLSDCSGGSFDPTTALDDFFAGQKKPLPGERKPLFPEGTPGIQRGVPPELVKGYQQPPADSAADAPAPSDAKAKAKGKAKAAAAPAQQGAQPPQSN
jgi:hypothetical protein